MTRAFPKAPEGSVYTQVFEALEAANVEYAGATDKGGLFTCPVHADSTPSLSVDVGRSRPLFYCFPCCGDGDDAGRRSDFLADLKAYGVPMSPDDGSGAEVKWGAPAPTFSGGGAGGGKGGAGRPVATYRYNFADGSPNFKAKRFEGEYNGKPMKCFSVSRWVREDGRYVPGIEGVTRTPYMLDRFGEWAEQGKTVYLVEGEKAADALLGRGKAATTFQGGTSAPMDSDWTDRFLGLGKVRVWPDADEIGVEWAKARARELAHAEVTVEMFGVPDAGPSDDAADGVKGAQVLKGADMRRFAALKPKPNPTTKPIKGKRLKSAREWSGGSGGSGSGGSGSGGSGGVQGDYSTPAGVEPYVFAEEMIDKHYFADFPDPSIPLATEVSNSTGATGTPPFTPAWEEAAETVEAEGKTSAASGSATALTLRFADEHFWLWEETHFRPLTSSEMSARISKHLRGATEVTPDGEVRPVKNKRSTKGELLAAIQDLTLVSRHGAGELLPAKNGVPFLNGWLDAQSGTLLPLTPHRDIKWVVQDDYDPTASKPVEWLKFLTSLGWTRDTEEYRLLRMWFGYLLSGDTSQQKALMLVGPKRAGKGTILGMAEALLGDGHVGLDLSAFSSNFGLSSIVGKAVATVGDARFDMRTDKALIRRLLSLIGEDSISIDRKHKEPISVHAGARLMVGTNEVPSMIEASDALASRFLFLKMTETFYGREDRGLKGRVAAEIPGVVRWALRGLADLEAEGRFAETQTGIEMQHEMVEIGNPINIFVDEECTLESGAYVFTDDIHTAYAVWAEQRRHFVQNPTSFVRDLKAAFPTVGSTRRMKHGKQKRAIQGLRLG